ncbi:MAG: DUF3604 domain-containing protein [Deltaproteobacteria bacterium]|nr:DUF3604 domain-containing protein [Deltaproteobacteria bacterium]
MRALQRALIVLMLLLVVLAGVVYALGRGAFGRADSALNRAEAPARSTERVEAAIVDQRLAATTIAASDPRRQILFGDLHVHTTISFDAFMLNLPMMGGEGAHTPADACDFARHCAALDFYSINDHAANIDAVDWRNTTLSIRQCNDLAGDSNAPDMVALLGWEWTQAGKTPDTHYGHKNVVLAHTDDARIPTRPIAASVGGTAQFTPSVWARGALALQGARFRDLSHRWTTLSEMKVCGDRPVRELPDDCREIAPTPVELFAKLDDWGHDSIVIPHGMAWGIYTPPGSSWDKQLSAAMHDPDRQTLIEVYSGHGESEIYRDWRAVDRAEDASLACPPERADYLPMCRRAGQLVMMRCLAEGAGGQDCEARAEKARQHALAAGAQPHVTVPGASGNEWLDAGQCRDCKQPAFKYRPASSAQYIAAIGNFEENADEPQRFRMGFIASSDIHNARAGSGWKELRFMTDAGNRRDVEANGIVASFLQGPSEDPIAHSRSIEEARTKLSGLQLFETERSQSFLYTGGLVAVHADGRDRDSVWQALKRKEVYGTSGPRLLLWFDWVDEDERLPMGSELETNDTPHFEVRAVGSFEQAPGCPDEVIGALAPDRLERMCRGECYNPTDIRRPITRIEVARIRPQTRANEPVSELIDDPWLRFDCPRDPAGCTFRFEDPDFERTKRDTVYYVRAFEEPTPTVNGAMLRCESGIDGPCTRTDPCPRGDECLAPEEPRAWSSPIYVDYEDD